MRLDWTGCNRLVILTRRYAIKVPTPCSWRNFLFGLLNNQNEYAWRNEPGHCPVLFALPGGWLVVMPRLRLLTDEEFFALDLTKLPPRPEKKAESFAWLNGKAVAVDYGW